MFEGVVDCFSRVYREQGLLSFWRGNGANIMRYFPHQALSFAFKDKFKAMASGSASDEVALWKVVTRNIASAGAGGGISLVLLYPLDMARTRLATDVGKNAKERRFTGTIDCIKKIYAERGLRGVYTGLSVSITGVIVFRGLFMGGYDTAKYVLGLDAAEGSARGKNALEKENLFSLKSILMRLGAAQIVTLTAGTLCYPIDTVRRRVMMQSKVSNKRQHSSSFAAVTEAEGQLRYRGAVDAFFKILQEEGVRGLYSGLSANLIRGIAGPILLVSYDMIRLALSDDQ